MYLNGEKFLVFNKSTEYGAVALLGNGMHTLEAVMMDSSGIAVGNDAYINFEVDIIGSCFFSRPRSFSI